MIALKILDVKAFMSSLLIKPIFDDFLLSELELITCNSYKVSGRLNKGWFLETELEALEGREYAQWRDIKPIAYTIIKGNRTPISFKIICLLPGKYTEQIMSKTSSSFRVEDIDGLFLNIRFEKAELHVITGTSMKTFSLDKSLEHEWDNYLKSFLSQNGVEFEIA